MARAERARLGPRGKSKLLNALSFDDWNKGFKPNRTSFDWLSRDAAEVDKYVADPLCGFLVTTQLWVDLLDGTAEIADPARQAQIPKDLSVFIFAGSEDPVGGKTKGLQQLVAAYQTAGLRDVKHKFYPGGRHEMLNETNRDEVTRDVIAWLDERAG
ncbi:MAG: alpha/beta hydrolase [Minicystis sp.]